MMLKTGYSSLCDSFLLFIVKVYWRNNTYWSDVNMGKRKTYEEVYEIFKSKGYKLLDKEYIDNRTKMSYEDSDGYRYETTLERVGKKCSMATKSNKWSIYNIKKYVKINGDTDILISNEFVDQNSQLDWVCKNGHEFHTNWNNYYAKGFRCKQCAIESKMYTFEQCVEDVNKRDGYKLLDMERRKNNKNTLVIYYYIKHMDCGSEYWVCKQDFNSGYCCKKCSDIQNGMKRRDNEEEIRNKVHDDTIGEYKYIKSKFIMTKSNKKRRMIKVRHISCGNEYWVDYSAWNKGSRCGKCYPIDRYAVPYDEWRVRIEDVNKHNISLLNVHYKTRNDTGRNEAWLELKCNDCGRAISRVGGAWNNGCPNCSNSKGEEEVKRILIKYDTSYVPQQKYKYLVGVKGRNLSYDFYIPSHNLLIEYQGEFHDGTDRVIDKSYFPTQQEHDRRKKQYAIDNNIRLLEIWYWDYDNIEEILKKELKL